MFWPVRGAEEMAVKPSPEVAGLGGYADAQVDLATGQGSISYPLVDWNVGGSGWHWD